MNQSGNALRDVIRAIIAHSSESILYDEMKTIAMFSDLAPQLVREKELLRQFYRCNGYSMLFAVKGKPDLQKKAQLEKVSKLLMDNFWVSDIAAHYICDQFWWAISGEESPRSIAASKETYRNSISAVISGDMKNAYSMLDGAAQNEYVPALLLKAHLGLTLFNDMKQAQLLWTKVEETELSSNWQSTGNKLDQTHFYSEALAYYLASGEKGNDSYSMFLASKMWIKKGCRAQAIEAITLSAQMGCSQARTFRNKLISWPEDVIQAHAFTDEAPV